MIDRFKFVGVAFLLGVALLASPSVARFDDPFVTPKQTAATTDTTTLNKMIDEEAAKLPRWRKAIVQRMLANPETREDFIEKVMVKLEDNKKLQSMQATFGAEEFTADSPMKLDPEIKKVIMDVLMKLLPILLQLIFKV